ncbi:Retrovirus-related Pol polyprotein from transposon TNT 1-94 [Grifola frondosa]|uniref:Retrovirus-related Pol polyprotein from transposon TNT 1-94 n=1 Tax=Grifola frondosa TaxID=5627 RepID=A0A1C7M4M8_GRIFR|nr:Retrovirus-related Pol polyprotein from transposon TNT 1-94 [Grifola frondosa]
MPPRSTTRVPSPSLLPPSINQPPASPPTPRANHAPPDTADPSTSAHASCPISAISVSGSILQEIPLLDLKTNNYTTWQKIMRHKLAFVKFHRNWYDNDQTVLSWIHMKCSEEEQKFLDDHDFTTSKDTWAALHARHLHRGAYNQLLLLREMLGVRFSSAADIPPTLSRLDSLVDRFLAHEMPTGDQFRCLILLNAMSGSLDHLQSDIGQSLAEDRKVTSIIKLCSNCKASGHVADTCWQEGGGMAGKRDEVLAAKKRAREKDKGTEKDKGGSAVRRDTQGRAYIVDANTKQAFYLADSTVTATSTTSTPSSGTSTPSNASVTEFAGLATDVSVGADNIPDWLQDLTVHDDTHYEAYVAMLPNDLRCSVDWDATSRDPSPADLVIAPVPASEQAHFVSPDAPFLVDSGATIHISPCRADFSELVSIAPRGIEGFNGTVIHALGIGKIHLRVGRGNSFILENVLYVPKAAVRLISVGAVCDGPHNPEFRFRNDSVRLVHPNGTTLFTGSRCRGQLYRLNGSAPVAHPRAMYSQRLPSLETWHRRLGHANYPAVYEMARRGKAAGMPVDLSSAPPKCELCILGKQTRTPVPKVREGTRATARLELVYVDVIGPSPVKSASGNLYSVDILDDHSSCSWTQPIPSKDRTASVVQNWVTARELETGSRVKALQFDNGELVTTALLSWAAEKGINIRRTAPYTSAHNGRVERLHRTLMSKSRTMRLAAGVPENRWDEFYVTANYLTIRTPTASLHNTITPLQAYSGSPPDLSHLREIGCKAFILIQNRHNPKIYERSTECVLIGYGPDSKTYRCYHKPTHKVVSSYHVEFIESHDSAPKPFHPGLILNEPSVTPSSPPSSPSHSPSSSPSSPSPSPVDVPSSSPSSPSPSPVDVPSTQPSPPTPPTVPRRSTRVPVPSDKRAEMDNLFKLSAVQEAIAEATAAGSRQREMRRNAREHAHAATLQLEQSYTSDPTTLKEAMSSPFANEWRTALAEEFTSIKSMVVLPLRLSVQLLTEES